MDALRGGSATGSPRAGSNNPTSREYTHDYPFRSDRAGRPGFIRSGLVVPSAWIPLPGRDSLKEDLVCEVLALVDQVDRLSPADDLADVAVRLGGHRGPAGPAAGVAS